MWLNWTGPVSSVLPAAPLRSCISLSIALSKMLVRLNNQIRNWSSWETVQQRIKTYFPINNTEASTVPKEKTKTYVNLWPGKGNRQLQSYRNYSAGEVALMLLLWCCSKQVHLEYSHIFFSQSKMGCVPEGQYCPWRSSCLTKKEQISDGQLRHWEVYKHILLSMESHSGDCLGRVWRGSLHFFLYQSSCPSQENFHSQLSCTLDVSWVS